LIGLTHWLNSISQSSSERDEPGGPMLDVHCRGCDRRVLVTSRRILAIENHDHGIVVRWACPAGHLGATRTGRARSHAA
jgi:hypothetical protein